MHFLKFPLSNAIAGMKAGNDHLKKCSRSLRDRCLCFYARYIILCNILKAELDANLNDFLFSSVSVKDLMYACIYLTVSAYLHSSMYMKLATFKIDLFSCGKQLARLLIIPLYLKKVCVSTVISVIVSSLLVNNTVPVYHWSHLTQLSYLIMLIYKLFFMVLCCRFQVFYL